jgi:hypothetical protein
MGQLPRAAPCCITAKAGAATNCPSHGQRAPGTSSMRQPEWTTQLRSVGRLLTPALPRTKQAYVHDQPRGLARTHQCRSASKARARPTRVQDARRGRAPTHGAASPDDCSAMAKQKSARGRSARSEVVRSERPTPGLGDVRSTGESKSAGTPEAFARARRRCPDGGGPVRGHRPIHRAPRPSGCRRPRG